MSTAEERLQFGFSSFGHKDKRDVLLQLEEGHGSVGVQENVHAVGLHAFGVALHSCFVLPLLEVSVPLWNVQQHM